MAKVFEAHPESKLIGLAGTFCAGKDTAADHMVAHHGFMHVSTGNLLRDEASRQGKDHTRPTLIEIGVELRRNYGSIGALVLMAIEQWQEARRFPGGLVISGLRVLGEAEEVQEQHGRLVFVDAPAKDRYERQKRRALQQGRTVDTAKSFEDFVESERLELDGLAGSERPNIGAIRDIADIRIWNNVSESAYLYDIEETLGLTEWAVSG